MPALLLSSRFTTDSQRLRTAARDRGWETLRIDGAGVPEWFEAPDDQIALFYTAPHAFDIAGDLQRTLLGCSPDWATRLPNAFLKRELWQTTLSRALELTGERFAKHSVSKAFPAGIYDAASLRQATTGLSPATLLHLGEPVEWLVEYRCFVATGKVMAISPYQRFGNVIDAHGDTMEYPESEMQSARDFANSVLDWDAMLCPAAFVLDVGLIDERGWAVVEVNECWASGIYACEPRAVLDVLLQACPANSDLKDVERLWDFQVHYHKACDTSGSMH